MPYKSLSLGTCVVLPTLHNGCSAKDRLPGAVAQGVQLERCVNRLGGTQTQARATSLFTEREEVYKDFLYFYVNFTICLLIFCNFTVFY